MNRFHRFINDVMFYFHLMAVMAGITGFTGFLSYFWNQCPKALKTIFATFLTKRNLMQAKIDASNFQQEKSLEQR